MELQALWARVCLKCPHAATTSLLPWRTEALDAFTKTTGWRLQVNPSGLVVAGP